MTSRIDAFLSKILSVSPEELERDPVSKVTALGDPRIGTGRGFYARDGYRPPSKYWHREGPTRHYEYWVYKPDRLLRAKIYRDECPTVGPKRPTLVVLYLANTTWIQAGFNRSANSKGPQTVAEASLAVMASISRSPETQRRDLLKDRSDRIRIKLEKTEDETEQDT